MLLSNEERSEPWLSEPQVAKLTKKKHIDAQIDVLVRDGIPFRMVAGRPLVLESALLPVQQSPTRPKVKRSLT